MESVSKIQEKREELKALSLGLKILKREGAIDTINEGLKALYLQGGHSELKTIHQWNESGKRVKKGEKALLLWGRPKKLSMPNSADQIEVNEDVDEMNFFPICFVFSNLQVWEAKQ
jgi:hypothetical protein